MFMKTQFGIFPWWILIQIAECDSKEPSKFYMTKRVYGKIDNFFMDYCIIEYKFLTFVIPAISGVSPLWIHELWNLYFCRFCLCSQHQSLDSRPFYDLKEKKVKFLKIKFWNFEIKIKKTNYLIFLMLKGMALIWNLSLGCISDISGTNKYFATR